MRGTAALCLLPMFAGCFIAELNDWFASATISYVGLRLPAERCGTEGAGPIIDVRLATPLAGVRQPDSDTCWAAAWEMIGRHYGGTINAQEYARRLEAQRLWRAESDPSTARLYELLAVRGIPLHDYSPRTDADHFARPRPLQLDESTAGVREALESDAPIAVLLRREVGGRSFGHVVMIESASFVQHDDSVRLLELRGIDPQNGELTTLDCNFLAERLNAAFRFDRATRGEIEAGSN